MSQQLLNKALEDHLPGRFSWEVKRVGRDFNALVIVVDAVYRFTTAGGGVFTLDERAPYTLQKGVAGAIASLC